MAQVVFHELGFPVVLVDPPMVEVRGHRVPDVNLREVQEAVLRQLIFKSTRLTGAEVRFLRKLHRLRQADLAHVLNMTNHSVVSQWESRADEATGMEHNTEVVLRMWLAVQAGLSERLADLVASRIKNPTARSRAPLRVAGRRAA